MHINRYSLFILLLLAGRVAHAQQVFFSEDFDRMVPYVIRFPWTHESTSILWQVGEPYQVGLYQCYQIPGDNGQNKVAAITDCSTISNNDNSNVLLKTPLIDLSNATGAFLEYSSFFAAVTRAGVQEQARVEISVDSGATWTLAEQVTPVPDIYAFQTRRLNLNAYAGQRIKIGFRYSDNHSTYNMAGWAIDNIKVYQPDRKDLAILRALPDERLLSYVAEQQTIQVRGTVMNAGIDTINSFILKYQDGAGPVQSDTITGIQLATFDTLVFAHRIPFTMPDRGDHTLKVWTEVPGDTLHGNDVRYVLLHGAAFLPRKVLAIEQSTGTWNMYAPRGIVYFNRVLSSDYEVNLIMVHDADPMEYHAYDSWIYLRGANVFNYQPSIYIDRRTKINPDRLYSMFLHDANYFGFADLDIKVSGLSPAHLTVDASVRPAVPLIGDYRLAVVVTEDNLRGNDTTWSQRNIYRNGPPGSMGGFESKPDPVPYTDMVYNFVARKIYPAPEGGPYTLSTPLLAGDSVTTTFNVPLDPSWQRGQLYVTALLINAMDSTILNSKRIRLGNLAVATTAQGDMAATLYPNPATAYARLALELRAAAKVTVRVSDLTGKLLWQTAAATMPAGIQQMDVPVQSLPAGMYLVHIQAGDSSRTLKLAVLH